MMGSEMFLKHSLGAKTVLFGIESPELVEVLHVVPEYEGHILLVLDLGEKHPQSRLNPDGSSLLF